MDFALNNLQRLVYNKTQTNKQANNHLIYMETSSCLRKMKTNQRL